MNVSPIMEGVLTTVPIQQGVIIVGVFLDMSSKLTIVTVLKVSALTFRCSLKLHSTS